jgi:hypothetical protein
MREPMKKKLLLSLMTLLFFTADAQSNECIVDCCDADRMNFYAKIFGGANWLQSTKSRGTKPPIRQDIFLLVRLDFVGVSMACI